MQQYLYTRRKSYDMIMKICKLNDEIFLRIPNYFFSFFHIDQVARAIQGFRKKYHSTQCKINALNYVNFLK